MSDEQLNKLPKWAQEEFRNLQRERDLAVRQMNAITNQQTESPIYCDDYVCSGEQQGPTCKRRFFQGKRVTINWEGVKLEIYCSDGTGQRHRGIQLSWCQADMHGDVALIPEGYMQARLIRKEYMR